MKLVSCSVANCVAVRNTTDREEADHVSSSFFEPSHTWALDLCKVNAYTYWEFRSISELSETRI